MNNRNIDNNKTTHRNSPVKHLLHMVLCCGLPILILFALPFIAKVSPWAATGLGFIAPFICPIMMGGMIFMMFGRKQKPSCCDSKEDK